MTHPLPIRRPYGRINFGARYQRRARYVWVPLRMLMLTRFLRRSLRRRRVGR